VTNHDNDTTSIGKKDDTVLLIVFVASFAVLMILVAKFGGFDASIVSVTARWVALMAMLPIMMMVGLATYAIASSSRHPYLAVMVGAVMFVGVWLVPLSLEKLNASFDSSERRITVRILALGYHGDFDTLTVEDWNDTSARREIHWSGSGRTTVRSGMCLTATVGDGTLGLAWMSDKSVAHCPDTQR
jgi:hypothetical protein